MWNRKSKKFSSRKSSLFGYILPMLAAGFAHQTQGLTLNEYIESVKKQNQNYRSFIQQSEAAKEQMKEADLIFSPQLFGNARVGHDKKLSSPPMLVFDDTKSENYQLGVSQQFDFGLQTKLYYELGKMDFVGASFSNGAPNSYWDASPKIELTLPLLGNGFGRTARANQQVITLQNQIQKHSSEAQAETYLIQAEATYWRLVAAQESVRVQEQALKAAQNILAYVAKKKTMNLGESADVLQAKALVENSQLQLLQGQNEERAARRAFNQFLNKEIQTAIPDLDTFNYERIAKIQVPQSRPGDRSDIKVAKSQTALSESTAVIAKERNRATLDIYGSYALNGRSEEINEALKNIDQSGRDTAFVGLRFSMPLNFSASDSAINGAMKSAKAAELNRQYKLFQQEQEWTDLVEKFIEAQSTLKLATSMEQAQRDKLLNERERLKQGRTTTYQVLLFEQDFSQSQLARVRAASLILSLQSQTQLYRYSSEGEK